MTSTIREFAHLQIPLEDVLKATNNFADKNIIGKGGFGNVYTGRLVRDGKSIKVAARRLDRKHGLGDVEFWTEISVLSTFKHDSLVSMIGFCDEKDEKIIINDHYAKGSLFMHLSDPTLTWSQRLDIAFTIADGIRYIHERFGHSYILIHRNINSSTILLDGEWNPKLSGFEFCIRQPLDRKNQVFLCEESLGTRGYMDPSTEKTGGVTHKSDIYSLGVVLFEILSGRKANEDGRLLAPLAKFHYENGTLEDLIHPDLRNQIEIDPESFNIFSKVAYSCLEEDRAQRPDAEQVGIQLIWAAEYQYDQDDLRDSRERIYGHPVENATSHSWKVKNLDHLRIGLRDIELATDNFSKTTLISDKKNYTLYKAELECFDRHVSSMDKDDLPKRLYTVRIKRIKNRDHMFITDIEILSGCRHPNIESLLGFCDEGPKMIFVYECASREFLFTHLNSRLFTWEKRLKICIDVANALNYLHSEREDQKMVIHRDISCSNIVLDVYNWRASIIGLELSVFLPPTQVDDALRLDELADDKHHIDPEYAKTGKLNRESDVFGFGAIMFEILFGEPANAVLINDDRDLATLVRELFDKGTIKQKLAPTVKEENCDDNSFLHKGPNKDSLDTFLKIAYQCLEETQNQRPTMQVVIKELKKALSYQENHKDPLRISFEDIKSATQDFNRANYIGGGGFGRVYKGELAHEHNGRYTIVVKKLDRSHGQGEKQYYNELQILCDFKHDNVIGLIGYSNETDEKLIVYEYASKGSLDNYLNDAKLTWRKRLMICIDIASGLEFLHGGAGGQVVIHRDIKTPNILLFEDWKAKLGDFGLSVISPIRKETISPIRKETNLIIDHACGTKGYVDPLYLKSNILTIESDIYSFGVILFEILCGRATYKIPNLEGRSLLSFIRHNFEGGKQEEIVFRAIKEEIVPKSLTTFIDIVYKCLDDDRGKRPTSKEVLAQLKKALQLQVKRL